MNQLDLNPTAASLLGFLLDGPKTGWDLVEVIEGSVGYFWNVTRSQVYRELKTLAAAGFVTLGQSGPRDRLPYEITAAGRAAFSVFLESDASGETMRLPIVVKVFFGDQVPKEILRRHVDAARAEHQATLATYRSIEALAQGGPRTEYQRKCLELGIAYETMFLAWIDDLPTNASPAARKKKRAAT